MADHYRPTRAEATDAANAIPAGTDCVMRSEESAVGKFPVEAVNTLAKIAAATEPHRSDGRVRDAFARHVCKPIYSPWPTDVEGFDCLTELALDMRRSWNHAADGVWRHLRTDDGDGWP